MKETAQGKILELMGSKATSSFEAPPFLPLSNPCGPQLGPPNPTPLLYIIGCQMVQHQTAGGWLQVLVPVWVLLSLWPHAISSLLSL